MTSDQIFFYTGKSFFVVLGAIVAVSSLLGVLVAGVVSFQRTRRVRLAVANRGAHSRVERV